MARNSAQGKKQHSGASTASTSTSVAIRVRSRPDPFLVVCRCFSIVTSAAAILCISVNILSAIRSFKDGSDIFDGIFRCYAVVIAMFVVVAETEWGFMVSGLSSFPFLVHGLLFGETELLQSYTKPEASICARVFPHSWYGQ